MVKTLSHSSRMVCLKRRWFSACIYAPSKCSHTFTMLCEWNPLVSHMPTQSVLRYFSCFAHLYVFYPTAVQVCIFFSLFSMSENGHKANYSRVASTLTLNFCHAVSFLVLEMRLLGRFNAVLIWSNFQAHVCLMIASKSFFGGLIYCVLMVYYTWPL